jgi:hypothetical protein
VDEDYFAPREWSRVKARQATLVYGYFHHGDTEIAFVHEVKKLGGGKDV